MELTNYDVLVIASAYQESIKDKIIDFPVKVQWKIVKNMQSVMERYQEILLHREAITKEFNDKWFTEEFSFATEMPVEEGSDEMQEALQIKDEYLEKYKEDGEALSASYEEYLAEIAPIEITTFDFSAAVDGLSDDTMLTVSELALLNFMDESTK